MKQVDVIIVGAGFAGLACAKTLAGRGIKVVVLERKKRPGLGIHTTGILVKEAAQNLGLPDNLTRKISGIKLYSPALKKLSLQAPDYYFLTTDTPALMRHFSQEAEVAGAEIMYGTPYSSAFKKGNEIFLPKENLCARYLIGADGPRSKVAEDFGLGKNQKFLLGVEAEFKNAELPDQNTFYCFLDNVQAFGYIGWVIPGVGITQVGLATTTPQKPDLDKFLERVSPLFSLQSANIIGRRGGLIPVGGTVKPFNDGNVILLGDAAGTVSPFTAGGIHTAMHYGDLLGQSIADYQEAKSPHPVKAFKKQIPKFYIKHFLRWGFERFAPNWLLDKAIGNFLFRRLAKTVFFKQKRL